MSKTIEKVELTTEEMDICFMAVGILQKDAEKVSNSALGIGAKKAATSADEFKNKLEDLKNKFLHE